MNKLYSFFVVALLCLFSVAKLYAQCDVTSNLIGRWPISNGNGNDVIGTNHISYNFYHTFQKDRFNVNSSALLSASDATYGANISIPTAITIMPFTDYTVSFWVNVPYYTGNNSLFFTNSGTTTFAGCGDDAGVAGNDNKFYIWNGTTARYPSQKIDFGKWYFITYAIDQDSITLYINGEFGVKHSKHPSWNQIQYLSGSSGPQQAKRAIFDDFRVYDILLSPAQIASMYKYGANNVLKVSKDINLCASNTSIKVSPLVNTSSYQWFKNNVAIPNSNDSIYNVPGTTNADTGSYFVVTNNSCRYDTSGIIKVYNTPSDFSAGLVLFEGFSSGYQLQVNNPVGNIDGNGANGTSRFGNGATAVTIYGKAGYFSAPAAYNTAFADTSCTMSVWYKYNSTTTSTISSIFGSQTQSGGFPDRANLVINTGGQLGYMNANPSFVGTGYTLTNGQWYNLTVVRNGTLYKLYVNGSKVFEANNVFTMAQKPFFGLGGNGGNSLAALGTYEDFRFYNYPISDMMIYDLFAEVILPGNAAFVYYCDSTNAVVNIASQSSDSLYNLSLQWYKDGVALVNGPDYSGVNTNALTINNFTTNLDSGTYVLKAYKNCVEYTSTNRAVRGGNLAPSNFVTVVRQPLCTGQSPAIGFTITNTGYTSLYLTGPNLPGMNSTTTNPYTNLVTGTYSLYAISNYGCSTQRVVNVLPPLNGNLVPSYNNPVYSGDSLKLTSNAALYISTSSTNGWNGPGGSSVGAYLNLANATTAMNGIYTITATNASTCTVTSTLNVTVTPAVVLASKAYLSGPYSTVNNLMHDSLRAKGLIPLVEPYSSAPYNAVFTHVNGGNETVSNSILNVTGNDAIVDWVLIELRSAANSATVVATKSALIQRDGDIVDARTGSTPVSFTGISAGNYYVSIKHRNHLGIMSKNPIALNENATLQDFTLPAAQLHRKAAPNNNNFTYNSSQDSCTRRLGAGSVRALYAGNANITTAGSPAPNKVIRYNGSANDRITLLSLAGSAGIVTGYLKEDLNMNGEVKYNGSGNDRLVLLQNIGTVSNTVQEQTPN